MSRVYLDHASTSPLRPQARAAMAEWADAADPGRVHAEGRAARHALESARAEVARLLGTRPRQVVFTSGGTEAVNAATFGACRSRPDRAVAVAGVEHSAVRESSARWGAGLETVPVDRSGRIVVDRLAAALAAGRVGVVQCQLANQEVGALQPVAEVADLCRRHGAVLHVDATAAAGWVPIDFDGSGADLMSVSAHRLGGPRGIGALLVRRGLRVEPLLLGGAQERARRAGLENVPAAVGFGAVASVLAGESRLEAEAASARRATDRFRAAVAGMDGVAVYGPERSELRLPNLVCLGVAGIEAEPVLIGLDQAGVAAHSGSACASEDLEPSPVLAAMGLDADHSLRFSVGWSSAPDDLTRAAQALCSVVERLRRLRG